MASDHARARETTTITQDLLNDRVIDLCNQGWTKARIAAELRLSRSEVAAILSLPDVAAARADAVEALRAGLIARGSAAVEKLDATMQADDPRLAWDAARDVLDRIGLTAKPQPGSSTTNVAVGVQVTLQAVHDALAKSVAGDDT